MQQVNLTDFSRSRNTTLLYTHNKDTDIIVDDKGIEIMTNADSGVKARVMKDGFWHDFGGSTLQRDWLKKKLAEFIPKKELVQYNNIGMKTFKQLGRIHPDTIKLQDKVKDLKKLQARIKSLSDDFLNVRVRLAVEQEEKEFLSGEKHLRQELNLCTLIVVAFFSDSNDEMRYHYLARFMPGYEAIQLTNKEVNDFKNMIMKLKNGRKITPGKYTCIMSNQLTGLLAHESFGHGMESDTILKDRAMAKQFLGKKLAKDFVSIIDSPSYSWSHGSYFFDDEGHLAEPTYLMKNGIVNHPITEAFSAKKLGYTASPNSRAESYDHKIYARMTNTYFDAGPHKPEDMIKSVKDGFYLHQSSGGMEDPKSWGIQIQGITAERIKNGRLTGEMFFEVGMTGFLPDLLGNICMVGNDLKVEGVGRCGKGHKEWVRVSEGGPHLLVDEVTLA
ncbi:TldD/PmbA family protein [Candidatus Woesearchaeota archaeon]|nr:TldD/PmbA family protein [Candidatus Woesearchaeota archaeon]